MPQPARPAAVSGPGAGSARTDGGAGNASQPLRVPSGGRYGERKAATAQQQSAPLAAGGPSGPAPSSAAPSGPPATAGGSGVFGPTQRPLEDPSTPVQQGQTPMAASPQAALRVMYSRFPHPAIAQLIDWGAGKPQ